MKRERSSEHRAVNTRKRQKFRSNPARRVFSLTLIAWLSLIVSAGNWGLAFAQVATKPAETPQVQRVDSANLEAQRRAAALVTEFDVNGLKVLIKQRPGSLTVAGGLFLRGGSRNITAENAGVESLMLDVATEASVNFPRERLRAELSRMGTLMSASENYDYSV